MAWQTMRRFAAHPSIIRKRQDDDAQRQDSFEWLIAPLLTTLTTGLVRALRSTSSVLSRSTLGALLASGDIDAVVERATEAWVASGDGALRETLTRLLTPLALRAATATPTPGQATAFFPSLATNTAITQALDTQVALVSRVTQEALASLVSRVVVSGLPVIAQIDAIRAMVGLTPQQVAATLRYGEGLVQAGETVLRITDLIAQRANALLERRAMFIARTAAQTLAATGQQARWQQAASEGALDVETFRRYWRTVNDGCQAICQPIPGLNPNGVRLDEPFDTPIGPLMTPTAHPLCLCSVEGVFDA